ncbi:hypothetical protein ACFVWR_12725 [Leifsonia sp. NPDC058292]|uniref:hypothetical protein n=1 Tax=Leifsonia sp. NPDC058292 TaxID=3346428 RepID=UPI0036D8ECD7
MPREGMSAEVLLDGPRGRRLCLEVERALNGNPEADGELTDTVVLQALRTSVSRAMYWQEPDPEDMLAGEPEQRASLMRAARMIAESPLAAWWASSTDRQDQWLVTFEGAPGAPAPAHSPQAGSGPGARRTLDVWRAAVEGDETRWRGYAPGPVAMSGPWWSVPPRALLRTTRSFGRLGPLGVHLVEDAFDWRHADVCRVAIAEDARVLDIAGATEWADLCRRYPLDVTASRENDWSRATGRSGRWLVPDWVRVAGDYDGVHLTVGGYLSAAGRAIEVVDDWAGVIAGWAPDETVWLRDGVAVASGDTERWTGGVNEEWWKG